MYLRAFSVVALILISCVCVADEKPSFEEYLAGLKAEALDKGYDKEVVDAAFASVKFRKRAVKKDRTQPERVVKRSLDDYLATRVPKWKVRESIKKYRENKNLLEQIAKEYGVQARFIVAIWGLETNFGKIQGKFPIMSAVTTLAYEGRREAFFKKQLFASLQILQEGHITLDKFVGSWAGAMGQSQFIPTTYLSFAVDYDKDGKKDIWTNKKDVFASIANYLKKHGWNDDVTWGRQVLLPEAFDTKLAGLQKSQKKKIPEWSKLGITRFDGTPLPEVNIDASLVIPDDENGLVYLAYENYHTILRWNRSNYFACSVGYLSDRLKFVQ